MLKGISIGFDQSNVETQADFEEIPQLRKIPPISLRDTIVVRPGGESVSLHGQGELFSDGEIIEKLNIIRTIFLGTVSLGYRSGREIYASYTANQKAIIQQQATRGCTAATAAMLIVDHGKTVDLCELVERNLGNDERQIRDIQKAGLNAVVSYAKDLKELREFLIRSGSAIVSISGKIGGHAIVVDEVSEDLTRVRLRDPYHGWEITVRHKAFLREWKSQAKGRTILQIAS